MADYPALIQIGRAARPLKQIKRFGNMSREEEEQDRTEKAKQKAG
jgi:hypothetical protein